MAFSPTISRNKIGVNLLHATLPLNMHQKSMVNNAAKHLYASAGPTTPMQLDRIEKEERLETEYSP